MLVAKSLQNNSRSASALGHSIALRLNGVMPQTVLAEFIPERDTSVVFRWSNNDNVVIDIGKILSVSSQVHKVGSVHITYMYTKS
jgi:hypothetical protein